MIRRLPTRISAYLLASNDFQPVGQSGLITNNGQLSFARRSTIQHSPLDVILREETLTLHLWNEKLRDLKHRPPPTGSPLAKLYAEFGV